MRSNKYFGNYAAIDTNPGPICVFYIAVRSWRLFKMYSNNIAESYIMRSYEGIQENAPTAPAQKNSQLYESKTSAKS